MTPDEKLLDDILHQSLNGFRFSAAQVAKIMKRLETMKRRLVAELANANLSLARKRELTATLTKAEQIILEIYGGIPQELDLADLGRAVASRTGKTLTLALGAEAAKMPAQAYFKSLASEILIQGSPAKDWWAAQAKDTVFKFSQQVRQGLTNGETNQQIIGRIVGTKTAPGIMDVSRRNAATLVQTSVQAVANDARLATFRANADVVKGIQQISTLDSHTSEICIAYSGAEWDLDGNPINGAPAFNGGPPRHFNCRSVIVPITKTFAELGIDAPEPKPSTRASSEGQISAKTSFNDFLERKGKAYQDEMLGPGRADLWRAGKITTRDLIDGKGRPLNLAQLEKRFGADFDANAYRTMFDDAAITPEAILEKAPVGAAAKIASVEADIAAAGTTEARYLKDGSYTTARQSTVHSKIYNNYLSKEQILAATPEGGKGTFTVLGGRGGSGKTLFNGKTYSEIKLYDEGKAIVINSDDIKAMFPEYKGWNAAEVHAESNFVLTQLLEKAKELNLNVVLDGTMEKASAALSRIDMFKKAGYNTNAFYMHLPRQVSTQRAIKRYLDKGKDGRYVPIEILLGNVTNEQSFNIVLKNVDNWAFYDNNVPKGEMPKLIARKNVQ